MTFTPSRSFALIASAFASVLAFSAPVYVAAQNPNPPLPSVNAESDEIEFSVAGKAFAMPVPEAYCTPEGDNRMFAQRVAEADSSNYTLAHLDVCEAFGVQYVHVKTPRAMSVIPLPRNMFLVAIANEFETGGALEDGMRVADDDLSTLSNGQVSMAPSDFGYSGRDDDCVYLSGIMRVNVQGQTVKASAATCITLTESRMLSVNTYDFTGNPPSFEALRENARQMAMSIRER